MNPSTTQPTPREPNIGQCEYCGKSCCNCPTCVAAKGNRVNLCMRCKERLSKIHSKV